MSDVLAGKVSNQTVINVGNMSNQTLINAGKVANKSLIKAEVVSNKTVIEANIVARGERGEQGDKGDKGDAGYNSYELWLQQGHTGTIEEYLSSYGVTLSAESIVQTDSKSFISVEEKARLSGYVHDQIASSKSWMIPHPLKKFPAVSIVDTGGNLIIGEVTYLSDILLRVDFTAEFSGKAYLN